MQTVHGGMYEPDPPPSPIPAPAPALPQGNAVPLYGQARAPLHRVYDDLTDSDNEEDPQNPFHGVDYREQQELLRQAALIRNRTLAARQEAARYGLGWQAGAGPAAAANAAPRVATQPAAQPYRFTPHHNADWHQYTAQYQPRAPPPPPPREERSGGWGCVVM